MEHQKIFGLPPFYDENSKLLILGSFPSVLSRKAEFYYGNKQNAFWRILSSYFEQSCPLQTEDKKLLLSSHNIALWDVVQSCEICGSADTSIKNYTPSNLNEILSCADIKNIFLNGGKAAQIFKRHFNDIKIPFVELPSTSPANTRRDDGVWYDALRRAFN
jgi:hypoxanthine-DNA glycosylase